jgi:hypothetical protein
MKEREVVTPLGYFRTGTEAALAHGVSRQAVSLAILSSRKHWSFYSEERPEDVPHIPRMPPPPPPPPRPGTHYCPGETAGLKLCGQTAKYEEDGRFYCYRHLPSRIAAVNERWMLNPPKRRKPF